jgi:hypothetical protein
MKHLISTFALGLAVSTTLHPLTAAAAEPAATGATPSQPSMDQKSGLSWKTVPTQTITAGGRCAQRPAVPDVRISAGVLPK